MLDCGRYFDGSRLFCRDHAVEEVNLKVLKSRLMTPEEVAQTLQLHPEVIRRWLRQGKIPACKIGRSWRVQEEDLRRLFPASTATRLARVDDTHEKAVTHKSSFNDGPKMCFKFPKWLEFSGLPMHLNNTYGPEAWPLFKKIIELDFELGEPEDRTLNIDLSELMERIGYSLVVIDRTLKLLEQERLIKLGRKHATVRRIRIITPLKTPKIILDIPFQDGGVKNAPEKALSNRCLRRYLEAAENG